MTKRVQMSRRRPWRAANPSAIRVDRATRWGNPYRIMYDPHAPLVIAGRVFDGAWVCVGPEADVSDADNLTIVEAAHSFMFRREAQQYALARFEEYAARTPGYVDSARTELAGHDLACWCELDDPCHGDVLLRLAATAAPTTQPHPAATRTTEADA